MKNSTFNIALITGLLLFASNIKAQEQMPNRKMASEIQPSENNSISSADGLRQIRVKSPASRTTVIPAFEQITVDIKWYAIENADNAAYWSAVNQNRIWIELAYGVSPEDVAIADFLLANRIDKIIGGSRSKKHTNYIIVELLGVSPARIVALAKAARSLREILFLEPTVKYEKHYEPNDPLYNQQWAPYVTFFDEAWDQGFGGNSYNVVSVIDDACDWNHEDLYDQVWYGYDYAEQDADISPDDPINHKHGTHTTGTVAATTDNGIGVAGMVNDTVYFAKVGRVDGTLSDQAIVESLYDIGDIDRITAVNMSLGGDAPSAALEQACNYAWNAGRLLIVSSGNNGMGVISFPAAYPACMAVGSIGADGINLYLTTYSQYGNEQEICAPGGDINTGFGVLSCVPLNGYEMLEGTSMAAPHVTGLAGLLKHINPVLTNYDIRNIINATAIDYGNTGWIRYTVTA